MRIEPARRRRGARVGLTPLIDVVFLLLVFFIIGGRLEDESRIRIASAAPAADQPAPDQSAVRQSAEATIETPAPIVLLTLESDMVWRFSGRAAAPEAVLDQLVAAREQHPTLQVVLVPGPRLAAQGLVDAIDRLEALGVVRIAYLAE
jgi:biopolymer transport protein ExbD